MDSANNLARSGLLRNCLFGFSLVLALGGGASADIIPDGYRNVRSELLIEGMENYPDLTFAVYPVSFDDGGGVEVKSGQDIRFYHFCSPDLYALPAGTDVSNASVFNDPKVPRSDVEIDQVGNVRKNDRAQFIRRVYRITGIEDNRISLERQADERFGASGKPLGGSPTEATGPRYLILGSGAVALAFAAAILLWLRRSQRGEASPAA